MKGYRLVNLFEIIDILGEDEAKSILSNFYCPLNLDVEKFLTDGKAIEFSKQRIAATHLVFASYKKSPVLVGYFTLANKFLTVNKKSLSNRMQKRINKFAHYDHDFKKYMLSAPLIAQLGKNYHNVYDKLIKGDDLLQMACDKVENTQLELGGKVVYLECEDVQKLVDFYNKHGFFVFGNRSLDPDEKDFFEGDYLLQMLKYL